MTSERENCGLSSLLPLSCRDRAEAFARSLQTRLNNLGPQNSSSDERSWLGPHEKSIALSQPLHNPEAERYLELEALESPCSPQEELEESELHNLLNKDSLSGNTNGDCLCPKINGQESKFYARTNGMVRHHSVDSDNDVFYDMDDDPPTNPSIPSDLVRSQSSKSIESETGIDINSQGTSSSNPSETFATSLDCTPQPSLSDDLSTLSVADDCSLVENITNVCESCENSLEIERDKKEDRKSESDEGYVNGIEESEKYISNLTVHSELVLECKIEADAVEEVDCLNGGDDGDDGVIPRVRRCSSLKTGKTPPDTPGRKKIVRFADVLGLDLTDVRTFLDEVPKVPKSAYNDLSESDLSDASDAISLSLLNNNKYHGIKTDRILLPLFEQPAGLPNFLDIVRDNLVCLENALVDDPILFLIKGTVRVRNLDFHKSVHIRYSLDSWSTFADVQATYVSNSCDGFSDRFSFTIYAHTLSVGQKLEFACRFQSKGCQYWDNNKGKNYCFQCLPSAASSTTTSLQNHGHFDWGASFY